MDLNLKILVIKTNLINQGIMWTTKYGSKSWNFGKISYPNKHEDFLQLLKLNSKLRHI